MATRTMPGRLRRSTRSPVAERLRPGRAALAAAFALVLAAALFIQAVSGALSRRQPVLAADLPVTNGAAYEQLAMLTHTTAAVNGAGQHEAAQQARPLAMRALASDPLSPRAIAIAALAAEDRTTRRAILDAGTALNRRDLLLQGLMLEDRVARNDYSGTVTTLDAMLRVHPEQRKLLFPLLQQALSQEAAVPELARLLDGSSDWHKTFLQDAAVEPRLLTNLGALRLDGRIEDQRFDKLLVAGLVKQGELDLAYRVYSQATGKRIGPLTTGAIEWSTALPPFDWELAGERGMRIYSRPEENRIDLYVRGGQGGTVARKLIRNPRGDFAIRARENITPPDAVEDVRLRLRCPGSRTWLFDRPFADGTTTFAIDLPQVDCNFLSLEIYARAWSGQPPIQGAIDRLEIVSSPVGN